MNDPRTVWWIGLILLSSGVTGCSLGPSQLARCRMESEQLQQRLAEEQQLRQRQDEQMRVLAQRLAESEKQLARQVGSSFAERPRILGPASPSESSTLIVPPPGLELPEDRSPRVLEPDGWRPSRRVETVRVP